MTTTAHRHHARRHLPWLAIAPAAVVGLLTMASPSDDGFTLCPVALLTGVACPGCGMSRAIAWLLRGDWDRAIEYHPLAPVVLGMGLVAVVWALGKRFGGWKAPRVTLVNRGLTGLAALLVLTWVARFATGNLPPV